MNIWKCITPVKSCTSPAWVKVCLNVSEIEYRKKNLKNFLHQHVLMSVFLKQMCHYFISFFLFSSTQIHVRGKRPFPTEQSFFLTYLPYVPCFSILSICSQVCREIFPTKSLQKHALLESCITCIILKGKHDTGGWWRRKSAKFLSYALKS